MLAIIQGYIVSYKRIYYKSKSLCIYLKLVNITWIGNIYNKILCKRYFHIFILLNFLEIFLLFIIGFNFVFVYYKTWNKQFIYWLFWLSNQTIKNLLYNILQFKQILQIYDSVSFHKQEFRTYKIAKTYILIENMKIEINLIYLI